MASAVNGEASSSIPGRATSSTLDDAMRAPSKTAPDVIVLSALPEGLNRPETLDPKEDLWLSTADGRFSSSVIPLRVGIYPDYEIFQVHKSILVKSEYFRKALCGDFKESEAQSVDLPEEDPNIFHFLVAYLYENTYAPTRSLSSALLPELDKGKGKEIGIDVSDSDSDSSGSFLSDSSARSRRRHDRRRRRDERQLERMRQKHPGVHRPQCNCPQCHQTGGAPCWSCGAPRVPPPIAPPMPPPGAVVVGPDRSRRNARRRGADGRPGRQISPPPPSPPDPNAGGRIKGEDLRTWLLAYELNIDVYICANKFLLDDFKEKIQRSTIDMLETAGADAAQPEVLHLCRKLYGGLSENDTLLKMVFARVGFLQPVFWKRVPEETNEFLITNPEVNALILRETTARREEELSGRTLPSMERPVYLPPAFIDTPYHRVPHPRHPRYYY